MLWELPETGGFCEQVWAPSRPRAVRTSQEMLSLALRALPAAHRRSHLEGQLDRCLSRSPLPAAVWWGAGGEGHSPAPDDGWAGAACSGPECEPSTAAEDRAVDWGWLHRHRMVPDLERSLSLAACDWRRERAEGRRSVLNQPFLGRSELPSLRRAQCFSFPPPCCCWERASLGQPLPDGQPPHPLEARLPLCTKLHPGATLQKSQQSGTPP